MIINNYIIIQKIESIKNKITIHTIYSNSKKIYNKTNHNNFMRFVDDIFHLKDNRINWIHDNPNDIYIIIPIGVKNSIIIF